MLHRGDEGAHLGDSRFKTVLEPHDEYPHEPDEASNDNESMYHNGFDPGREVGGWFRLGNRVDEGDAETSVCLYLPGGRVGFMFGRCRSRRRPPRAAPGPDTFMQGAVRALR